MKLFFISLGCPLVIIFCLVSVSFAKSVLICPLQEADASVKPRKTVQMKGFCVNVEVFNIGAEADCEKIPHPSRPNGNRRAVIHPPAPHHTEVFCPSIGCEVLHRGCQVQNFKKLGFLPALEGLPSPKSLRRGAKRYGIHKGIDHPH